MAGTTSSSKDNSGLTGGSKRDLIIQFNKLIDDVAELARGVAMGVMPGMVLTAPATKTGTSAATAWRSEAMTFTFRGKITSAAAQEKAFTATTHDVAASKQAWFALSLQTDGTTFTITKAADQTIGTDVYATTPDNEVLIARLKIVTGAGGIWDASTDNLAVGGNVVSVTFQDAPGIAAAGQLAAKIGNSSGTAITA